MCNSWKAFAPALGLGIYRPPIEMPSPEIQMYWHSRHDRNPAHRWIRKQICEVMAEVLEAEHTARVSAT
jgi:DNA-binding transcriptional LysR family regulator